VIRAKGNRRKPPKRELKLPRIRINWTAVLVPPATAVLIATAALGTASLLDQPVRALEIEGSFERVPVVRIEEALAGARGQGFLTIDLKRLRRSLQGIDWVERAEISRAWPDTLRVRVIEQQAAARWGEDGLLNVRGELFTRDARHGFPELPRLAGPPGSEEQVARLYLAVRGPLAEANFALDSLVMDGRGAWTMTLGSGQEIRLGREAVELRLERFFAVVAPTLAGELDRVSYVDLRYTNGFAIGWVEDAEDGTGPALARSGERANRG
jgi:cell division protein FtsQ